MAEPTEISTVRRRTGEHDEEVYSDEEISDLIDERGVDGATVEILRERVARFSKLVDVTEANASRRLSQAFEHSRKMLAMWEAHTGTTAGGRTRIHRLTREGSDA